MKKTLLLFVILTGLVFSLSAESHGSLSGREIVQQGEIINLSGVMSEIDNEWFIDSDNLRYAVHLGNEDYVESLNMNLKTGDKAEIYGFQAGTDIAVCRITFSSDEYMLRDSDGTPAWSGKGRGRNKE